MGRPYVNGCGLVNHVHDVIHRLLLILQLLFNVRDRIPVCLQDLHSLLNFFHKLLHILKLAPVLHILLQLLPLRAQHGGSIQFSTL